MTGSERKNSKRRDKRIQRVKNSRLLSHFNISPEKMDPQQQQQQQHHQQQQQQQQQQQAKAEQHTGSEPKSSASPTLHHNLSYKQQQQIHHRQIERRGGLERLSADLAGLDFNEDSEQATVRDLKSNATAVVARASAGRKNAPAAPALAGHRSHSNSAGRQPQEQAADGPTGAEQAAGAHRHAHKTASGHLPGHRLGPAALLQQQAAGSQNQAEQHGYDDQMTVQSAGKENELELAQLEAQEMAEDGQPLKKYKLHERIGTGNYARVYKTVPKNGKELAVKVINLSRTSDNYRHKFLPRELTIMNLVHHFNICKVYEIIKHSDRIYIVMQYCTNGTIADLLHKLGSFSEPVARYLFKPSLEAVAYLHAQNIAHRDLKLENILLDQDFNPKLTDFSYSTQVSHSSEWGAANANRSAARLQAAYARHQAPALAPADAGPTRPLVSLNDTFCGTLPYLSPEMIRQQAYDSKKTDVWSLGVCLFVMLNDRLPFGFNDVRQMIKEQLSRDFKFKAKQEFSDEAKDLVHLMLEPDFGRRPASGDLLQHAWLGGRRERPHQSQNPQNQPAAAPAQQ